MTTTIPTGAEQVRIAETGQRFYRVHGGAYDGRWSRTEETVTVPTLSSQRLLALGTVEIVPGS